MTQEDLVARSGVAITTIQRAERGERLSADTIAALAAAFDLDATELTCSETLNDQPYLPLEPIRTGRQLVSLISRGEALDFGFVELNDLAQAELVEQLQSWCSPLGTIRIAAGPVAQVRLELEATEMLKTMAERGLNISGASFHVTAYDVDDDCGAGQPILFGQSEYVCVVLRVGTRNELVDRAHVMDGLGKWEHPGAEVIFPAQPGSLDGWSLESDRG